MATTSHLLDSAARAGAAFVTTPWSVVLAAQDKGSPQEAGALETLCRIYWWPLYADVRRLGHGRHDAENLTQEFFARLRQKDYRHAVDKRMLHMQHEFVRTASAGFRGGTAGTNAVTLVEFFLIT